MRFEFGYTRYYGSAYRLYYKMIKKKVCSAKEQDDIIGFGTQGYYSTIKTGQYEAFKLGLGWNVNRVTNRSIHNYLPPVNSKAILYFDHIFKFPQFDNQHVATIFLTYIVRYKLRYNDEIWRFLFDHGATFEITKLTIPDIIEYGSTKLLEYISGMTRIVFQHVIFAAKNSTLNMFVKTLQHFIKAPYTILPDKHSRDDNDDSDIDEPEDYDIIGKEVTKDIDCSVFNVQVEKKPNVIATSFFNACLNREYGDQIVRYLYKNYKDHLIKITKINKTKLYRSNCSTHSKYIKNVKKLKRLGLSRNRITMILQLINRYATDFYSSDLIWISQYMDAGFRRQALGYLIIHDQMDKARKFDKKYKIFICD